MVAARPKPLDRVALASVEQVTFGKRLGIDCSGKSVAVSWAMIEDVTQREFWGEVTARAPSQKQIELAAKFGYDISTASRGSVAL